MTKSEQNSKKLIWIIAEFLTIVLGTYISVYSILRWKIDADMTALGISLIALGIMIRLWRKEFFPTSINKNNKES